MYGVEQKFFSQLPCLGIEPLAIIISHLFVALAVSSHNCAIAIFQHKYACFLDGNCQEYLWQRFLGEKSHYLFFYTSLVDI